MSRLEKLIGELCPDGVAFKPLWEVTNWDKKFNTVEKYKQDKVIKYNYYLAADLKSLERSNGDIKILTTNITNLWTDEEEVKDTLSEGEVVCIPWGGNPIVQYYKGKFVTGDNRIATSKDINILNNKFLYYCLQNKLNDISSFYRGSGIKHPDMSKVLDLIIPIPPLEVQEEIVRILDTFTELTVELTAELTARKKQYEYYRNKMLSFGDNIKSVKLSNVCNVYDGTHQTPNYTESGIKFASVENIQMPYNTKKHISVEDYKKYKIKPQIGDVLMTRIGSIGVCYVIDRHDDLAYYVSLALLRPDTTSIDSRYLKHYLESIQGTKELRKRTLVNAVPIKINKDDIGKISIKLPPLEEQRRIASILDRFETLCNDISAGLPAEIEARKKQYEFYRDKLLTFKEMS